jgi:hypothetical protein
VDWRSNDCDERFLTFEVKRVALGMNFECLNGLAIVKGEVNLGMASQ